MKRNIAVLLSVVMSLGMSTAAFADRPITVTINDAPLAFDVPPQILNDRTMVPMRKIFEALGADVEWDGAAKAVRAEKGGKNISLVIGEAKMDISEGDLSGSVTLDAPASIIDGRTLVPVRAIAESFDCEVLWEKETKTVKIFTEEGQVGALAELNDPSATAKQREAYQTAGSYLYEADMAFSREGLKEQLTEGSGFSASDAEYAVKAMEKNGSVDWNAQAYKSAKEYYVMTEMAFSGEGMKDQLTSGEGFTKEQAEYAVSMLEKNEKVNWKEQAYENAKRYLIFAEMAFSREGMKDQLTMGEKFTAEQAEYAVSMLEKNKDVDWKEQARLSAKAYSEIEGAEFTKSELTELLVLGEGYTEEQAEYGVSFLTF